MNTLELRKICKYISRGISPDYVDSDGILVLNQKCIRGQKIDIKPARLSNNNKKFNVNKKLQKFDILINSTGVGTLGRVAQLKNELEATVDSHVTIYRVAEVEKESNEKIDPAFVGYCVRNQERYIELMGTGATGQTELSKDDILDNVKICFPKYSVQMHISSVLSAYDDLIENNERRIKILEEMAQRLYEEWFVKFKFPGHDKVKMIDSKTEYGMIPEGWSVNKFANVFEIKYGKNLPISEISYNGRYKVYGAGGIIGYYSQKNIDDRISLITCRGNGSGTVWRTFGEGFVTNNSFTIKSKLPEIEFEFIFPCLKYCNIASAISGSAQPQITIDNINFVKLVLPTQNLIELYINQTKLIYELSDKLRLENKNLSETRNLLIPQLVTGRRELK